MKRLSKAVRCINSTTVGKRCSRKTTNTTRECGRHSRSDGKHSEPTAEILWQQMQDPDRDCVPYAEAAPGYPSFVRLTIKAEFLLDIAEDNTDAHVKELRSALSETLVRHQTIVSLVHQNSSGSHDTADSYYDLLADEWRSYDDMSAAIPKLAEVLNVEPYQSQT